MRMLVTLALAAALIGCAHRGADLSGLGTQFKVVKGQTTEQELISRFGEPQNRTTRGSGETILTWHDGSAQYIPVVGAHVQSKTLAATIRDGVVTDYTETEGGY